MKFTIKKIFFEKNALRDLILLEKLALRKYIQNVEKDEGEEIKGPLINEKNRFSKLKT